MTQKEHIAELKSINKQLAVENARLTRELDGVAMRARQETNERFWRAAYEELLDKVVGKLG